jgi:arylsulfatase A-like enzyme
MKGPFMKTGLRIALVLLSASLGVARADDTPRRPNVLFIAIDDLNHWVGHLGRNPQTRTPNIDRLAASGVAFSRAYCTAPACNPSRASLMSGLRPSTTGCYENDQNWRPAIREAKLLNTQFFRAGYRVYGAGKIYHGDYDRGGDWTDYLVREIRLLKLHPSAKDDGVGSIKFGPLACTDEEMPDYEVVSYGLEKLKEKSDKPFFLAIGLVKPHLPFSVPKKWFDMFPLETIQLPPHRDDDLDDVPPAGVKMARPDRDHAMIVKAGRWKEAVQAYLATIAFCDSQVGRLLDGLEKSPYRDNTIVCLWSDHGWSLGEKSHWKKFALWEEPTRTVFAWRIPGLTRPGGLCGRPVDFLSIYPTLCALAGLPLPSHLEGRDIIALLKDPNAAWDQPAVTTWKRGNHAVRAEDWRYIRYANGDEELYHNSVDPYEYTNLAGRPEHAATKAALARILPKADAENLPRREIKGEGDGQDDSPDKAKSKTKKSEKRR